MKRLILLAALALAGCNQSTYMDDQAAICRSRGGEPMQTYAVFANGLVMGCHFEEEK